MKRSFLFLILSCTFLIPFAQKIEELTDNRGKRESFLKLQRKDVRNDLAAFTLTGVEETLFKGELTKIPYAEYGPNFMTYEGDGIKASVTTAPFVTGKHRMDYDEKYLIKIDRKPFYGDYGKVPKSYISNITMTIGKDSIQIPSAAYFDLYNFNFAFTDKEGAKRSTNGIYRSRDGSRIYLYLFCKDNSGSYEVTFVIENKKYAFRVLDYGFM
ncbi:MAG: hypothetical protein NVS3B19_13290 [Ginsengibacter sp.]